MSRAPDVRRLAAFRFLHDASTAPFPPELETVVADLWARRGRGFDGPILSVVSHDEDRLVARTVSYRHFAAQRDRPDLFPDLQIRPLAVTGLVRIGDSLLFGERSGTVEQETGSIELVPSGGVEPACIRPDGIIDICRQFRVELEEEVGMSGDIPAAPVLLVDDGDSHVVDIIVASDLPLSPEAVQQRHAALGSDEYKCLLVIPEMQLHRYISDWGARIGIATREALGVLYSPTPFSL